MKFNPAFCVYLFSILAPMIGHAVDDVIPIGPFDTIAIRTIPAYPIIEAEVRGPMDKAGEKGFRQLARYVAAAHLPLTEPVVITYPETDHPDWHLDSRFLVHLPLGPLHVYPEPREMGLTVGEAKKVTVAGYAYRGPYTAENFNKAVTKLMAYLQKEGIPIIGPPRHLQYSVTGWTPDWMQKSEVQLPIPEKGAGN